MAQEHKPAWHTAREFATHWLVGGVILAATGFVPEEWLARVLDGLSVPADALHLWGADVDLRLVLVGAGCAVVAGDVAWRRLARRDVLPAPAAPSLPPPAAAGDLPLPDRPSIAVLPFANLNNDTEQEYFSDGVADDIITELSRSRALFVIARNSSFTYKGRAVDVRQVARELGVRYVLEGSVRRDGERIRVNAQLIDAGTGNHVWAERYDRAMTDVFAVQDEITQAVATAIHPAVADAELQRALRRPPENLSAWEAYQRGRGLLMRFDRGDTERARGFFRRAIALDPNFAAAYAALATTAGREVVMGAGDRLGDLLQESEALARRAVATDPADAEAHAALANALTMRGESDAGLAEAQRAVALNPSSAYAVRTLGTNLLFVGRPAEARQVLRNSLRLSPRDPSTYIALSQIMMAFYWERDYEATERTAREVLATQPDNFLPYRWLAAALGQLGRAEEAHTMLGQAIHISPEAFDFYVRTRPPWIPPELHAHMLDGLHKAGWEG